LDIKGIEGLSPDQVRRELERGAKFVVFQYCVSVLILTFRRSTAIYFVRPGEGVVGKALPWTLLTLVAGWWGFPWGLIYTPMILFQNMRGGKDVTAALSPQFTQSATPPPAPSGVWPPPPGSFSS
jgi:hypothetical protein